MLYNTSIMEVVYFYCPWGIYYCDCVSLFMPLLSPLSDIACEHCPFDGRVFKLLVFVLLLVCRLTSSRVVSDGYCIMIL